MSEVPLYRKMATHPTSCRPTLHKADSRGIHAENMAVGQSNGGWKKDAADSCESSSHSLEWRHARGLLQEHRKNIQGYFKVFTICSAAFKISLENIPDFLRVFTIRSAAFFKVPGSDISSEELFARVPSSSGLCNQQVGRDCLTTSS